MEADKALVAPLPLGEDTQPWPIDLQLVLFKLKHNRSPEPVEPKATGGERRLSAGRASTGSALRFYLISTNSSEQARKPPYPLPRGEVPFHRRKAGPSSSILSIQT
jgi:hypothetical protein